MRGKRKKPIVDCCLMIPNNTANIYEKRALSVDFKVSKLIACDEAIFFCFPQTATKCTSYEDE